MNEPYRGCLYTARKFFFDENLIDSTDQVFS